MGRRRRRESHGQRATEGGQHGCGGGTKWSSPRGTLGVCCEERGKRAINAGLTVEEVDPDHGAVGDTPIVDRLALSNDAIPKRCQVTNGRTRADVLQEVADGTTLAPFPKLEKQFRTLVPVGKEFVLVLLVEPSGDGVVDRADNGVVEERVLLSLRVEARNRTGARQTRYGSDGRERIERYIQCEETDATRIPRDDIVSSLEDRGDIPPDFCNELDSRAARPTYDRMLG